VGLPEEAGTGAQKSVRKHPSTYPQGILRGGIQLPFQNVQVAQLYLEHGRRARSLWGWWFPVRKVWVWV